MRNRKPKICAKEGCKNVQVGKGFCQTHYDQIRPRGLRGHYLYSVWWDRKKNNLLCPEWEASFKEFLDAVGDRQSNHHVLVRSNPAKLFSATNFIWQEHLSKKAGETQKEWWARKWQARKTANPSMERGRTLQRRFGISVDQYEEMHESQSGLCAICKKPETTYDTKSGSPRRLCVDHCHRTGKNRALLCFRCNATLGKLEEDLNLFESMVTYIKTHHLENP